MRRSRNRTGKVGRPLLWRSGFPLIAYEMALLGAEDKDIARAFGVSKDKFLQWVESKPELREALDEGKIIADSKVAASLYKRATGFSYEEEVLHVIKGEVVRSVVTKHVIPDPWSAHKWLSARQPQLWTDTSKSEITHTNININKFDFGALTTEELQLVERIGLRQIAQNIALG